jgi:hypothetical protein
MNRRLMIRVGLACASVCVLGWKLPGMLDGALSSIDEHKGAISLLNGGGMPATPGGGSGRAGGALTVLGAASALSPAERAKLLAAARKHDPLAEAQAKTGARTLSVAKKDSEPPAPSAASGVDPALLAAMRALGMDPDSMDLNSVDVDALLAQARGKSPKD